MARFFKAVSGKVASTFKHSTGDKEVQYADHNGKITYHFKALSAESPWAQKIKMIKKTITFNANGGSGTMPSKSIYVEAYTLPECGFTAPQYKQFAGWSYNMVGPVIDTPIITVQEDITLYAIWKPIMVTVSFSPESDSGEGMGAMPDVQVPANEYYYVPACSFTPPTKMQFMCWSKSKGGSPQIGERVKITADTTLYAIWEPLHDVRLNRGDHAAEYESPDVVLQTPDNSQFPLPSKDEFPYAVQEGYEFEIWTDKDGSPLSMWEVSVQSDIVVYASYRPV